jgi:hypothetical protein
MPLRFGNVGFATAYASLPIGTFEDEVRKIRGKIRLWRRIQAHDPHRVSDPDFIYLLGQADLAAQIRLSDFRDVFDIRYPTSECNATTVNWVFSVGFDLPELDLRDRPGDDFQFLLHLRYRRGIFAYAGAEEDVIRRVIELGREHQLIASVQAAMGWSDLIIEGTFTDSLHEQLTRFIISVHGLHLVIADEKEAVFDRHLDDHRLSRRRPASLQAWSRDVRSCNPWEVRRDREATGASRRAIYRRRQSGLHRRCFTDAPRLPDDPASTDQ